MAVYFGLVACCDVCQGPASRKLAAPIKCFLPSDGLLGLYTGPQVCNWTNQTLPDSGVADEAILLEMMDKIICASTQELAQFFSLS